MNPLLFYYLSLALAAPLGEKNHIHHQHKRAPNADPVADPQPVPQPQPIAAPSPETVYVTNIVMMDQFDDTATSTTALDSTSTLTSMDNPDFSIQLVNKNVQSEASPSSTDSSQTTTPESTTEPVNTSVTTSEIASSSTANSETAQSTAQSNNSGSGSYSGAKGITYSPYSNSGQCKSSSEIASDMEKLSEFTLIRVYAPDCNVISALLDSLSSNQQIFAGLFYLDSIQSDAELLATQVKSSTRGWDAIYAVAVGNEWVNSGTYSADTVVGAVSKGRSILQSLGYTGKVVTVDTVPAYQNNPTLCDASDFAAVNQHAFWNGNIAPENSGKFISDSIDSMSSLCNKDVLICETGWPTQGQTFGSLGVPGKSQQSEAIQSIISAVGDKVILFTTYNDLWKQPGSYGVEQYWGLF